MFDWNPIYIAATLSVGLIAAITYASRRDPWPSELRQLNDQVCDALYSTLIDKLAQLAPGAKTAAGSPQRRQFDQQLRELADEIRVWRTWETGLELEARSNATQFTRALLLLDIGVWPTFAGISVLELGYPFAADIIAVGGVLVVTGGFLSALSVSQRSTIEALIRRKHRRWKDGKELVEEEDRVLPGAPFPADLDPNYPRVSIWPRS